MVNISSINTVNISSINIVNSVNISNSINSGASNDPSVFTITEKVRKALTHGK